MTITPQAAGIEAGMGFVIVFSMIAVFVILIKLTEPPKYPWDGLYDSVVELKPLRLKVHCDSIKDYPTFITKVTKGDGTVLKRKKKKKRRNPDGKGQSNKQLQGIQSKVGKMPKSEDKVYKDG